MSASDLNFSDSQSISSDQEEFPPPPKNKRNLAYPTKNKGYCNCRMCKTCHNDQSKLSKEEIDEIRKRAKLNKNPKPKRCTKDCAYCQKVIERKNYKIYQSINTSQTQKNALSSVVTQSNLIEPNKIKNTLLKVIPSEIDLTKIETEPDGNCLIYSILKTLNIPLAYHRELIANKTREQNIDKKNWKH